MGAWLLEGRGWARSALREAAGSMRGSVWGKGEPLWKDGEQGCVSESISTGGEKGFCLPLGRCGSG